MSGLSLPSRQWSCATLENGVVACAQLAGISLAPDELSDPVKASWSTSWAWGAC